MDEKRFDELIRAVASSVGSAGSRRGLLRGLAAAVGAATLGRLGVQEAAADCKTYGKPCAGGSQCCSGIRDDYTGLGVVACLDAGAGCAESEDCCSDLCDTDAQCCSDFCNLGLATPVCETD